MIFKIEFRNGKQTEFAQSDNLKNLQKDYAKKYGKKEVLNFKNVTIIYDEASKKIILKNSENSKISLFDALSISDFTVINYPIIEVN